MWLAPRTDFSSVHGRFSISSFGTEQYLAYTYFADGALQTASNSGTGSNTWTYTYNKRRMLETEVLSYDNRSFALGHAYNALGHRSSLTYPSGQVVSFNPDARGRARQAGSHASSVSRHPNGAVNTFMYANGIGHVTALIYRERNGFAHSRQNNRTDAVRGF